MKSIRAILRASVFVPVLATVFVTGGWMVVGPATAVAAEVDDAIAAAMEDAAAGRCDQAVDRLRGIEGLASRAHLLGARCRISAGLYPEALQDLDDAQAIGDLNADQLGELELQRGVALYHLERFAEADAALDRAEGRVQDEAQLYLYSGMISLRLGENEEAALDLETAARRNPTTTEPVASYYAGLAWQAAGDRTKSRAALKRVVHIDPEGAWGREAEMLLESTKLFPFFARLQVGFENDDNVLLRATGTDRDFGDGDKDWRGVWRFETGVELFRKGDWSGGILGAYSGAKHHELGTFDYHYPTVGVFLEYEIAPLTLSRYRYNFGHAWVDKGSFLRAQSVQAALIHSWERVGTTELLGDISWNDFRFENDDVLNGNTPPNPGSLCPGAPVGEPCGPVNINEARERDRDGYGLAVAVEHRYLVPVADEIDEAIESMLVRGGYKFEFYDSQGTEWERFAHILSAGITLEFPWDVSLDTGAAYEHYDYLNPSTFPDSSQNDIEYALDQNDRNENAFLVEVEVEKDFTDYFSVSGRYSYYDSSSNVKVYDYRRHIVGAYVNFRFD